MLAEHVSIYYSDLHRLKQTYLHKHI